MHKRREGEIDLDRYSKNCFFFFVWVIFVFIVRRHLAVLAGSDVRIDLPWAMREREIVQWEEEEQEE